MTVREAAAAAARQQVVLAVSLCVHGRSLLDEGKSVEAVAALLRQDLESATLEWLEDLAETAAFRAGVEADPVVYGDEGLQLMTESEITAMIEDLVVRTFDDPAAPPPAHSSAFRM